MLLVETFALRGGRRQFSVPQREQMIRAFLDEPAFAHCAFPRGKAGIRIEDGKISPAEAEFKQLCGAERGCSQTRRAGQDYGRAL